MRQYDPNPGLSAFAVVGGAVLGIAAAVLLGAGALGILLGAVIGVLLAGLAASALGIVGERGGTKRSDDDLPPEYYDY